MDFGTLGAIASAVTEAINRGLGLEGRKAFVSFLVIVAIIAFLKVSQDLWPWAKVLWDWAHDLAIAILAGTGAHKILMSRKDA
ncbi:MAG: hypothetical protein QXT91_00600 [Candidatus Caldarchaeum sp.]